MAPAMSITMLSPGIISAIDSPMPKTPPIGIRLSAEERAALTRAAAADDRSISALARRVLADWLRRNGWLSGPDRMRRKSYE